jgi:hypothetical protein
MAHLFVKIKQSNFIFLSSGTYGGLIRQRMGSITGCGLDALNLPILKR